jgi:hypothetical protein
VKDCIPSFWMCLVQVKREHYQALADYYVALGLSNHQTELAESSLENFQFLHNLQHLDENERPAVPRTAEERKYLGDNLSNYDLGC